MSKHTPGPWTFREHGYPTLYRVHAFVEGSDSAPVCGLWMPAEQLTIVEEGRANARLIAAAPELLEALKAVESSVFLLGLHVDEDGCEGCQLRVRARSAIAKAEGR